MSDLKTIIDNMLDTLSDAMYEQQMTAPAITERGVAISPAEYELFCTRCYVIYDGHPAETDCPVGVIEHQLYAIQSQER